MEYQFNFLTLFFVQKIQLFFEIYQLIMPKFTKQKAHLNILALDKKNNSSSGNENQLETNLEQFSREESEESWFEEGIEYARHSFHYMMLIGMGLQVSKQNLQYKSHRKVTHNIFNNENNE